MRASLARLVYRGRAPGQPALDPPASGEPTVPDAAPGTSRRTLMTRGLWMAAGAIGIGIAGRGAVTASPATGTTASGSATNATASWAHSLFVRDVRFNAPGLTAGALPAIGTLWSPNGQVEDASGKTIGRFSGGMLPGAGGQIAMQRFAFDDGSLIGMGSGSLDGEEYAVVGGTGRYAGATGSYVATITRGRFGKDAEFVINLTGTKG